MRFQSSSAMCGANGASTIGMAWTAYSTRGVALEPVAQGLR